MILAEGSLQRRTGDGDHERALRDALGKGVEGGLVGRILEENQIIPHNFLVEVDRQASCAHPGCVEPFPIRLVPGQIVYPKWCAFHRPPHRRSLGRVPPRSERSWEESLAAGLGRA